MAGTIRTVYLCLAVLLAASVHAQHPALPISSLQPEAVEVTLGQAAVPLYGPWRFRTGDSPIDPKTGRPAWSEPSFDDSHWEKVDLTPKEGTFNPVMGNFGYVPGWTARGHADYSGYAWYRIRVRCRGVGSSPLSLAGPAIVDDAYQVFADGKLLGSFGDFSQKLPVIYYTQPFQFPLPESCQQAGVTQVLAFRFWMEPSTLLAQPDTGGMHTAPLLGEADVISLNYQSQWLELIRAYLMGPLQGTVFALLAVVAFSLILFDRSDRVYLWIGLLFLATAVANGLQAVPSLTQWIPVWLTVVLKGPVAAAILALWGMVWWVWFGRSGLRWLPGVLSGLVVLAAVSYILGQEVFPGLVSHSVALRLYSWNQGLRFVFFGLLAWVVIEGMRHRGIGKGIDGWLVLPVVLLHGAAAFSPDLVRLHLFHYWFPFGVTVSPSDISNFLVAGVISLLLLRRLLESVKRQREMALDVKQAQEVQQVILPERRISLPGFVIETEYRPAREVGGDFYQIIPHPSDGSVLIVAGDVAGKGLQAGMLVALLVGAIRTTAEIDFNPATILAALNRRLLGRGDARATCAALRIAADGRVTFANSGHMPPYLNGELLEIEGSLPLGVIEGAECSLLEFRIAPGDRLLLVSDGVAEATNAHRELFGFDRVLELMRSHPSAARVAAAAQAFGQDDDISVIAVMREVAREQAFA